MKQKRPVNLNLLKIRFPVPAIVSILHRMSGVILFLFIPLLLCLLSMSLESDISFDQLQEYLNVAWLKFLMWVVFSALAYHLVAGIRHMVMDIGFCESLRCGRASSYLVLIISAILVIFLGVWLW